MHGQTPVPAERVQEELAGVLRRAELRHGESLLERLIDWLAPDLRAGEVRVVGDVLLGIFAAVALVVLVRSGRRLWRDLRAPADAGDGAAGPQAAQAPDRVRVLADAARSARAAGDLRGALRLLLHALLVALGGRGDLELNAAWTNREILRRGRASREARALLEPLVRELEPKEYGRAPIAPSDLERLEALLAPHLAAGGG